MCNHQPIYQQANYGIYLRCIKCYVRSPVRPTLEGARRAWDREFEVAATKATAEARAANRSNAEHGPEEASMSTTPDWNEPEGEGADVEQLVEEGPELTEEEMLGFDDGPSEEVEPEEVKHDDVRDGA